MHTPFVTAGRPHHFSPRPNRAHEIHWREWGPDAFRQAKEQDKPILLGISAVWCHWCHVMDETSYSDDEVIRLANERYVPIRVDNDQRPDVNRRYNLGGWPTTAFLSPDGEILHGGTYIPPEAMRQYLAQVADLWTDKRDELTARVAETHEKESAERRVPPGGSEGKRGTLTWDIVDTVGSLIRGQYDPHYGGFGREPKFPQPKLLRYLIDDHRRHAYPDVATMLHKTLGAMAGGGMHDAIEGGFFRYSTTRQWQIPHYEKMLEDNAELLAIYGEAHRLFPSAGYDRVARDVIRWMDTVLWMEDRKAFAGSQDADEHYYTLDAAERAKHDTPYVDRTAYASWNSLAASAYVAAARALDDPSFEDRAHDVVVTVANALSANGVLHHYDAGSGPQVPGLLTDVAALTTAMLDLYETGRWPNALEGARLGAARIRADLEDTEHGGFWDAPEREELGRVTKREKPIEDGAVAADAFLRLAALTGDDAWRQSAVRALEGFVGEYRQWGQFAAAYATVVARALTEPLVVTVVGATGDVTARALWAVARGSTDPASSLHRVAPDRPGDEHGPSDHERLALMGFPDRTAAYVCIGTTCSAPLDDPVALEGELARARGRHTRD
ncbi:MAG: thioredoxin domain-containing protein [Chloroflexi bacterium]|nr:thioredoxin domain-containing protein [Chloroflexota bacterium]